MRLAPLRDERGEVTAVSSLAKDITELEAARQSLEARNVALEEAVRARTEELEQELKVARALAAETRRGHEWALLGDSVAVRALREHILAQSKTVEPALLGGDDGAGQESVARAIHERSARAEAPFLVLDCAALAAQPVAADGREPTAAVREMAEAASSGTLYLAYADLLSAPQQEYLTELVRAQQAAVASGRALDSDVRLIAYVAGDLGAAMGSGYLNAVLGSVLGRNRVTVPALAERREDLPALAGHVLEERGRALGRGQLSFTPRALERLRDHDWPGNLRELVQTVEAAVRRSKGTTVDIEEPLSGQWRSVGGYRLTALVGSGGMGEVWRAEHALLKRAAAVKLTRKLPGTNRNRQQELESRFRREAEVTAALQSPHTVQLFDFGVTDDGAFYYVMELLEGLSLAQLQREVGALRPARAAHLVAQACLSLAEAHARGLVHRDIKPDNLFACRMGAEADFVKVLDFGIVKVVDDGDETLTKHGRVMGTPAYIAPESVMGGDVGPAADLYALGCVLFRLVTGVPVFDQTGGAMALLAAHTNEAPRLPSSLAPNAVPPELDRVILQLLEKEPAHRPASALALRDALLAVPFDTPWTEREAQAWWKARDEAATRVAGASRARPSAARPGSSSASPGPATTAP